MVKIKQFRRACLVPFIYEHGKRICQRGSVDCTDALRYIFNTRTFRAGPQGGVVYIIQCTKELSQIDIALKLILALW